MRCYKSRIECKTEKEEYAEVRDWLRCSEVRLDRGEFDDRIKHASAGPRQIIFRYICWLWALTFLFCFHSSHPAVAHQPLSPEGHWKFDEGNGFTAADSSSHGSTGTLVNGPSWNAGKVGSALQFDGVNDYVDVGNAASLNPVRQISIAAWIRTTTIDASQFIVAKHNSTTGSLQYFLSVHGGGAIRFGIRTSDDIFVTTSAGSITPYTWHHVAGVFTSVDMRVYINGALSGTLHGVTGVMANNGVATRIGVRQDEASPFSGLIDEVRVYDRALTANEVAALSSVGDTTPPVISAVSTSNITARSATISWVTDEPADSRVEYGPTTAYGLTTALDPSLVSLHYKVLSNLVRGTTYNYRIVSTDAARNASASRNFTFTARTATSGPVGWWRNGDSMMAPASALTDTSGHGNTGAQINGASGPAERLGRNPYFERSN